LISFRTPWLRTFLILTEFVTNGRRRMDNWFNSRLDPETVIDINDSMYTNNTIGISFLKHFIQETQSSSTSPYKLLLFDGVDSYETKEFRQLARSPNIILHRFPLYLVHLMQPLNVGCFQFRKLFAI